MLGDFGDISESTGKQYRYWWRRWEEWCKERELDSRSPRPDDIVKFLDSLRDAGCGVSTVRVVISAIKKVHGNRRKSPTDSVVVRQDLLMHTRPTAATRQQGWAQRVEEDIVEKVGGQIFMMQNADTQNVRMALADISLCYLVLEDGLHYTEVAALTWGDIDIERKSVALTQRTGRKVVLPLSDDTTEALREMKPGITRKSAPVFPSRHTRKGGKEGVFHISPAQLSRRLSRAVAESGFEPPRSVS